MTTTLTSVQRDTLLDTLQTRFAKATRLHPHTTWPDVLKRIEESPEKFDALYAMEASGGQPDVVDDPGHPGAIVFMDCAAESPAGRRSLCYDHEALYSRKANAPADSAVHLATAMGIGLLTEAQYLAMQSLSDFDLKTSSWVYTPLDVRKLGGALFCDKRFGRVFTYHNGADSYYAARGFRGFLML